MKYQRKTFFLTTLFIIIGSIFYVGTVKAIPQPIVINEGSDILEPNERYVLENVSMPEEFLDMTYEYKVVISANATGVIFLLLDIEDYASLSDSKPLNASTLDDWIACSIKAENIPDGGKIITQEVRVGAEEKKTYSGVLFNNGSGNVSVTWSLFGPASLGSVFRYSMAAELTELLLMAITVAFFLYISLEFFQKSRFKESFEVERKLNVGYGLFFGSLAIGYGAYVIDRISRFLTGDRLFATADYSALSRDYFLVTFFGMSAGFIFLSHVIERYILNRKKPYVMVLCIVGFGYTAALRFIEHALLNTAPDIVPYLGYISYLTISLVLVIIIVIYIKIAASAPVRSDLWNRSVAFVVGLMLMIAMLIVGNNQLSKSPPFFMGNIIGPIITLIALFIMRYGFSKAK
ncbi:MAG: hypothetical protein ACTSWN_04940 [Promethearchaeota archaeon]